MFGWKGFMKSKIPAPLRKTELEGEGTCPGSQQHNQEGWNLGVLTWSSFLFSTVGTTNFISSFETWPQKSSRACVCVCVCVCVCQVGEARNL